MPRVVAIHQPNFFPWLGYFDKIARADVFIFLDNVQFPKTGGTWTNRVKLLIAGEARWVTAAIDRQYNGTRLISEMHHVPGNEWRSKLVKTIENEYRRHPYYDEVVTVVTPLLTDSERNVAEYNIRAITAIASVVGLNPTKMRRASDLSVTGSSNELLCNLTRAVDGSTYLCGGGAEGYQEDAFFATQHLVLKYQQFDHPEYWQKGQNTFVPGLSVIDAAMNVGWQGVRRMLNLVRDD